jgi:clan AA aspartic protease
MGAIHVTVTLSWPEAKESYESLFLVDTGSTDSIAPRSKIINAGFKPKGKMTYELADGQPKEYEFTLAIIEFMGEITSGRVVLGPDDAEPIWGVTAIESVGITVDPVNRTLKRSPAIPMKKLRHE